MNELLQKHGCSNVFTIPEGLRELMADITREVLRAQPVNICEFISNYLSALLITREHGIMSVRILEDLCDCRPSVSEHLLHLGIERETAQLLAQIIKDTIESLSPEKEGESMEKVREAEIIKQILLISSLDAEMTTKVCQIARNAYRNYWYTKQAMEKHLKKGPQEPWEIAAEHTLEIYKKTKPSYNELMRATTKIQSAYRGYHYRRHLLPHLKSKRHQGPKKGLPGPPLDIAASREIDLGPVMKLDIKTKDDVDSMLSKHTQEKLSLKYDPNLTIKNTQEDTEYLEQFSPRRTDRAESRLITTKPKTTEDSPHEPLTKESEDPQPNTEFKRASDTPWPFESERSQEEVAHKTAASTSALDAPRGLKTESAISQYEPRKKAISIIEKPKEFLIEARGTKVVYEAPKVVEETPAEVPEDLKDDESVPTASVPTETAADDTDNDVKDAVDVIDDNEVQAVEHD